MLRITDKESHNSHIAVTKELLSLLRSSLRYHLNCGIAEYSGQDRLESALQHTDNLLQTMRQAAVRVGRKVEQEGVQSTLPQIAKEIEACRSCPLYLDRRGITVGFGSERPELLIVGEWLAIPAANDQPLEQPIMFGKEEDQMIERMVAAMGLSDADVYITNIAKCAVPDTVRPTAAQAAICAAYLKQQIAVLKPRALCAMGTLASQVLTGVSRPLSMLRGKVQTVKVAAGTDIPVMPTYHPTFLLQNPEMKRAAWTDLQALAKLLQTSST